jgi:hypothetical protein
MLVSSLDVWPDFFKMFFYLIYFEPFKVKNDR